MSKSISTGTFGVAKFVVSADPTQGNYTTIASAIAAASSGDTIFIRDGAFTEDFTLPGGIHLSGLPGTQDIPNTSIIGKITFTASAQQSSISSLFLQTNGDYILDINTGTGTLLLDDCFLQCSDHTGISITGPGSLQVFNTKSEIINTGITLFEITDGSINFKNCNLGNSGSSTTASTIGSGTTVQMSRSTTAFAISCAGSLEAYNCELDAAGKAFTLSSSGTASIKNSYVNMEITSTGTGALNIDNSEIARAISYSSTSPCVIADCRLDQTAGIGLTVSGTGALATVSNCYMYSGAFECITIGVLSECNVTSNSLSSSAGSGNVMTGLGTVNSGGNVCLGTAITNAVAVVNHLTVI